MLTVGHAHWGNVLSWCLWHFGISGIVAVNLVCKNCLYRISCQMVNSIADYVLEAIFTHCLTLALNQTLSTHSSTSAPWLNMHCDILIGACRKRCFFTLCNSMGHLFTRQDVYLFEDQIIIFLTSDNDQWWTDKKKVLCPPSCANTQLTLSLIKLLRNSWPTIICLAMLPKTRVFSGSA